MRMGLIYWVFTLATTFALGNPLKTVSEISGWTKTGRHSEVTELCAAFEAQYPKRVKCQKFGTTPEGRAMWALIVSDQAHAIAGQKGSEPVVFFQGCIHAGESDGKDAGFFILREMLAGKLLPGILSKVTLVFVPMFNIDGHERFGKYNRPNQIGPEEMGWRTTAENLNLNRDYLKAEAPEMNAMLTLLNHWDPIMHIDLHVTDGAQFQHDVSVMIDPAWSGVDPLKSTAKQIETELMTRLTAKKHLPLPFYPSFDEEDNPQSGITAVQMPPRFSQAYWGIRNRIGVLVETHSWKDYANRIQSTIDVLISLIEMAGKDGQEWMSAAKSADDKMTQIAGTEVALEYERTEQSRTYDFLGYEYKREKSDVSGKLWTQYNPSKPQIWKIPLWENQRPSVTVKAPQAGYVIPLSYAAIIGPKLKAHGIQFQVVKKRYAEQKLETLRATAYQPAASTFENKVRATLKGDWAPEKREVAAGSLYVPVGQAKAQLVLHLLEPTGPDSLLQWGFLHSAFERKEYMEAYVAEEVAREMLKNSSIKAEFEKKLREDPGFEKDPSQRLEFFYRKHPSWDERYFLYPVYRTAEALS